MPINDDVHGCICSPYLFYIDTIRFILIYPYIDLIPCTSSLIGIDLISSDSKDGWSALFLKRERLSLTAHIDSKVASYHDIKSHPIPP
jgi:hypothetical protein